MLRAIKRGEPTIALSDFPSRLFRGPMDDDAAAFCGCQNCKAMARVVVRRFHKEGEGR